VLRSQLHEQQPQEMVDLGLRGDRGLGAAAARALLDDAADNRAWLAAGNRLSMPVLALGGEKSFGSTMAAVMRAAASNVTEGVIPDSGHWIMEENPQATVSQVVSFLGEER
jgi:pimeloyl-ACP methyl ester carboxylesterase